jgi:hypothetical protein
MGLLGNGFRHNLTGRISVATTNLDGCNASSIPASYNLTAMRRNMLIGGISNAQASVPAGKRPPNVWLMAKEGGSISSFKRANYVIDGSAAAEMGFSRAGSTTITLSGLAAGGAVVSATGSATLLFNGQAAIVATLNSGGTATVTINAQAVLDAIASVSGVGGVSIDASGQIMGLGYITGTTVESGTLTPSGIANAVWSAIATENNTALSMGAKLNSAASGGVDLNALAAAVWAYAARTLTEEIGLTVTQAAQLQALFELHGLDPAKPLQVSETARSAGTIAQTVSTASGTTTVQRTA